MKNPLGCKVGPTATTDEVLALCEALNPEKIPALDAYPQGADNVRENLPPLLAAVRNSGHPVVWACDPMHGNTYTAEGGHKTRHFDRILDEMRASSPPTARREPGRAASTSNSPATPSRSASVAATTSKQRSTRPTKRCDPANGRQSVDLAFMVAELLQTD